MRNIFKVSFLFLLSFLFCFSQFSSPSYSQSTASLNAAAIAEINGVRSAVSAGVTAPSFFTGAALTNNANSAVTLAGVAALGYLGSEAMQNLGNKAISDAPPLVGGQAIPYVCTYAPSPVWADWADYKAVVGVPGPLTLPPIAAGYSWSINNIPLGYIRTDNSLVPVGSCSPAAGYPPDTAKPPLSQAAQSLSNNDIMSAATAAAAAAALAGQVGSDNDAIIQAAAAAVQGLAYVPPSTSGYSGLAASVAAAAAAGAAAQASKDAQEEQARDKAVADSRVKPSVLPAKSFSGSTNFVAYALTAFSAKFPLDIIYGSTDAALPECPTFSLFYYRWTMCFLMPLFYSIRWIIFISLSTKVILEL